MTTFDEHSRDEVFRDYLNEARAAKEHAEDAGSVSEEHVPYHIGRGQIHATLAHAAATLLAAMPLPMPEIEYRVGQPSEDVARMIEALRTPGSRDFVTEERDALRDRVDELVAQGLTAPKVDPIMTFKPEEIIVGPASLYTEPGTAALCTCGHHPSVHGTIASSSSSSPAQVVCDDCDCERYTPNTTEVDGWSEPAARGARFRVARFEQNDHVPPVFFKVTDQLGRAASTEFVSEAMAQAHADSLNSAYPSTGTDASVETEAQPESPATALVTAAEVAISPQWDDETSSAWTAARAATIAVLRALASTRESFAVYGLADTVGEYLTRMANELEHTDTPTTE